ncbi:LLM class flavin-dependent oxidoreductase [Salinirubellus salinus]|uniref:LLM class flavin-dependent oxidoreductase n=1 Tax=Salinirubellus salinus TaxID=1364945 RepID=A0A9E7U895_9EURY|nr:LLM class flavin-dependent oxidoreductase [Salinirubellus salinus]UWM54496.1 LLM class flavin-dependent oxidoreductase [Salinirubellus salinus]
MTSERTALSIGLLDDLGVVREAERLGYESIWTGEGQGKTAFGKLERWATATDEIGLGASIVNVYSRTPAVLAQATATLDAHSDGRASLGLGVAHPGVVEGFHGVPFERPLPRMAEYIGLVRRYLAGVDEPFEGEFFSPERTRFWEAFEPVRSTVPIYNAALGPGNVRLTGEYADGWLPYLYPVDRFREAMGWLREGAERAGRSVDDVDVAMYLLTSVDEDADAAYRAAAHHVVQYLRHIPGYYEGIAREAGYDDEVDAAQAADTDADAVDELSEGFVESVGVVGTPDDVRAQLDELRDAGLDLPIVRAPMSADEDGLRDTMAALAPEGS